MSEDYDITQTLYQKTSTGKVYQWSINIETETSTDKVYVITSYGAVDGKKRVIKKEVPVGKAKRTKLEQAKLEATRKWINKHEKDGYQPSLITAKKAATKGSATDTNFMTIKPMLAQTYGKVKKPEYPVLVQRKFDGLRCLAYYDQKTEKIEMKTRNNKPYYYFDSIRKDITKLLKYAPTNFYIDGELYTDKFPFEEISGLARKKKASKEDLKKIEILDYYIYDCIDLDNLSQTNTERIQLLQYIFKKAKFPIKLRLASTYEVASEPEMLKLHKTFIDDGYEGTMIRAPNGHYQVNKRSKYLQKYKDFIDSEFEIVGAHEETGENEGCVVWECVTQDGKIFSCNQNGTRELRRQYFSNLDKYIGKKLTVMYQELTDIGVPRFPKGKAVRMDE